MSVKLITPPAILSFPHFDKPWAGEEGKKKQYSAMFVFPAGTNLEEIQKAIIEVAIEKWGKKGVADLASGAKHNPLTSATKKGFPEGFMYFNARSDRAPGLVYPWPAPGTDKPAPVPADKILEVFYPGSIVRASVSFYAYDNSGNRGVGVGLNNAQLIDGTKPRLDNRKAADEEFAPEAGAMAPTDLSDLEQPDEE